MTAKPKTQPVPARVPVPSGARKPDRLRRQLFVERVFFLAVIAALAVVAVRQGRALRMYQVTVNGKPVATVGDAATAKRLLRELQGQSADARFRETVSVQRADPRALVMTEDRARRALAATIDVMVPGYIILANGRVLATVATQTDAEQVLSQIRQGGRGPRGLGSARIEAASVSRARIVSVNEAVRALTGSAAGSPAGRGGLREKAPARSG
jgi:hypothetical protein